ncbi:MULTISPECIES: hypothetical protein [Hyphomicrobiales]|uniref:Uncharacterized protein n=2 Tax=Hyphomicrobiales TaxID=356 RepID=A0A974SK94_9HYPH|nr:MULTISPECIES: hypothetical protein [Hyphomicrobiales]MCR5860122.1 hypothetical protein [Mesorhizobium sp. J428]MCR5860139.1 hypothetical protein [Mesorhizobium sp. J428]MCR5860152.1 hypothetical protein [Mesorhizobium sp. J428]MCR5860168.1 hypothetical protein [Mesorhizobium sp. J428]MCR5860187.1 hypothetical protein [Mesorhizobium sp. J428]
MSQENHRIAAAIDLRMRQLEKQGIQGAAVVHHMLGYMQGLQQIYDTASDKVLSNLCQRYPGFYRYADMMESMSERNQQMIEAGTHPYRDLPELPEKLKRSLAALMASAADLERAFQSAVDCGDFARHVDQLDSLKRQWGADLQRLVELFRSSDVAPQSQLIVQSALKAMAERINRLG